MVSVFQPNRLVWNVFAFAVSGVHSSDQQNVPASAVRPNPLCVFGCHVDEHAARRILQHHHPPHVEHVHRRRHHRAAERRHFRGDVVGARRR